MAEELSDGRSIDELDRGRQDIQVVGSLQSSKLCMIARAV